MTTFFTHIKELLALLGFSSLIALTFTKIVPPEAFLTLVGMIIQYYFHQTEMRGMQSKIDEKENQIQALASGKVKIVSLDGQTPKSI